MSAVVIVVVSLLDVFICCGSSMGPQLYRSTEQVYSIEILTVVLVFLPGREGCCDSASLLQ